MDWCIIAHEKSSVADDGGARTAQDDSEDMDTSKLLKSKSQRHPHPFHEFGIGFLAASQPLVEFLDRHLDIDSVSIAKGSRDGRKNRRVA